MGDANGQLLGEGGGGAGLGSKGSGFRGSGLRVVDDEGPWCSNGPPEALPQVQLVRRGGSAHFENPAMMTEQQHSITPPPPPPPPPPTPPLEHLV